MTVDQQYERALAITALRRAMPNGASVADWLGTASVAAKVAASHMDDVRLERYYGDRRSYVAALDEAERQLEQATDELRAVRSHFNADTEV